MGHMSIDHMDVIDQIEVKQYEMADRWTLWRGEGRDIGTILVLIHIGTMIIIGIILTKGVIGDTFQMSLRKKSQLILMER